MSESAFYKVARLSVKAATMPFPVNENVVNILKLVINEEHANFILKAFKTKWLSEKDIIDKTQMDDNYVREMLHDLTHIGIIINLPHPKTGVEHFKVVAFFPGLLEFTLMKGERGEKQKKIAQLWENIFMDFKDSTQQNYEKTISRFKQFNVGTDRVIPVEKEISSGQDTVLPLEDVKTIINSHDVIGVAVCYCRHRNDLLNNPCKVTDVRENCILLGRTAQYCIQNGFAREISKEEALTILKKAEDEGLVHKAFHQKLDPTSEFEGLCNCCACCCGTFYNYHSGAMPAMSYSSYLAQVDQDLCVSCGTCVKLCPMKAIDLNGDFAVVNQEKCIGCGVCAHHCPEEAIELKRIGERLVFIPPPKIEN
jgi:Pyruvate/2-oxoacid:ferredoxin oxidoreductase delta subunit